MGPLGVSSMGQHLPLLNSTRAYGLAMNLLASGLRGKSKGSGGTPQVPFTSALRGLTTNKKMMIPLKRPKKIFLVKAHILQEVWYFIMCHPCSTHNPQKPYLTNKRDQIAQYIHEQIPHTRSFYLGL